MFREVDEKDYVPVNSGSLHGFAYECYVLSTAQEVAEEFGITEEEAYKLVVDGLSKEECVVRIHPDAVTGDSECVM